MAIDTLIHQIDYSKYLEYTKEHIASLVSVNIFDLEGKIIWSSLPEDNLIKNIKFKSNNLSGSKIYNIDKVIAAPVKNEKILYAKYIHDSQNVCYGGIAFIVNGTKRDSFIVNHMSLMANVITSEVQLSEELDSMSVELSARYEELNLVYESDDAVNTSDNGPEVLYQLVSNCTEYLDVTMTALILPHEELTIFDVNESEKIHYIHSILSQFKNYTYPWIQRNTASIVSNDLADTFRHDVFPDIPYKIICSPIFVTESNVGGLLITLNSNSHSDFTNSDRNLVEAMAKKAAKIAMSNYDNLTGLFKREAYEIFLNRALEKSQNEGKTYCILNIDIDGIKVINETLDTKAGDYLLKEVSKLLRENTRDSDVICRVMGDKYSILLDSCVLETGCSIADDIREAIQAMKCLWEGHKFEVTACIGVTEINADSENIQSVIAASELATGYAKENGRNIVQVYQQGDTMLQRRQGEVQWIRIIQHALKADQFELFCQPIMPICDTANQIHYEILLRLHANGEMISPEKFIPAAERFKLMSSIDLWVVKHAFSIINKFHSVANNYMWTINLSGLSLEKIEIAQEIHQLSENYKVHPENICFEITETATMNNFSDANKFINYLKSKGFSFALDDFGTGSSTFTYLKKLPVEYLKIDGSFVKDILNDSFADAIVCSINQVSHARDMQTIAEYVENDDILQRLKVIGVDYAQGYELGKPAPLKNVLSELINSNANAVNS
ncbi:MAG: putative bifunctional diguanylate cyclase/phosphodiesterase [Gammaproteobacteria bacterium]